MTYKSLKNSAFFLLPYLVIILIAGFFLISYSKSDIHIWLNQHWSVFGDRFFRIITFLGDGLAVISAVLLLLFYSIRSSAFLLSAYLSSGLIVQILKRIVFSSSVRPSKFFPETVRLHFIEGVNLLGGHSFPSGHSASAFSLFLCLAMISRNKVIQMICFFMACLVAYSRVYLSQHFLLDIYAGSIIGVACTLLFYLVFFRQDKKWHNWSLIHITRK